MSSKNFFPVDSGEPLMGEVVLWRIQLNTRATDILRPGHEELYPLDDLTSLKQEKSKFIKLQMSVSGIQQ